MRRAFWRGRELLIQQLGAWMFRCINSFQTLRALDGRWSLVLEATELPTTRIVQKKSEVFAGRTPPDFSRKAKVDGRGTAATDPGPRRRGSSDRLGRYEHRGYEHSCCTGPCGYLQLDRSFAWLGSKHRQGRATIKALTEYCFAAQGSGKGQSVDIIEQASARCRTCQTSCSGEGSLEACKPCTSPASRSTDSQLDSIAGFNANAATGGCIPFWDSASPDSSANVVPWCNTRASSVSSSSVWWWVSTTAATASTSSGGWKNVRQAMSRRRSHRR